MKNNDIRNSKETYYSHIIREHASHGEYTTFTGFIEDKIQKYRNHQDNRYNKGQFKRTDIASKMGNFDYDTLKRILNGNQRTRKRDLLIAVFAVLKLTVKETNIGLELYHMAPLNPMNLRDLVIQQAIADEKGFDGINEMLIECNCSPLNLQRTRSKGMDGDNSFYYEKDTSTPYEIIEKRVIPYYAVPYSSLSFQYYPRNYQFTAYFIIKELHSGRILKLEDPRSQNVYLMDDNGKQSEFPLYSKGVLKRVSKFGECCTEPEIIQFFVSMSYLLDVKARELFMLVDDTRNYGSRTTAYYRDGEIVIFTEVFNQEFPERSEYYQVEISPSFQKLSVSERSVFLSKDIGEERYFDLYGQQCYEVFRQYNSFGELISDQCKTSEQERKWELENHIKWFTKAIKACEEAYLKLQNKEVNIREIRHTESLSDLIEEFDVYNEFDCITSDDGCFSIPGRDSFQTDDGITIDLECLIRAAELGIPSVSEISYLIKTKGSVEAVLSEPLMK